MKPVPKTIIATISIGKIPPWVWFSSGQPASSHMPIDRVKRLAALMWAWDMPVKWDMPCDLGHASEEDLLHRVRRLRLLKGSAAERL
eukprot:1778517-Rhodomonas_salina.1